MEVRLFEYLSRIDYTVPQVIEALKQATQTAIASIRRTDHVFSLSDLLRILEKRDSLSLKLLDNIVMQLKDVIIVDEYNKIKNDFLTEAMSPSKGMHISPNCVVNGVTCYESVQRVHSAPIRNASLDNIYNFICNQLGVKHWREFARNLGMIEADIDDLGSHYSTKECVRRVLLHHEYSARACDWRQQMLQALSKAHRSDIKEQVERRLDYYNLIKPHEQ